MWWLEFYWDAKEAILVNALVPRGKEVEIWMFIDSDYEKDEVPQRSWSCFLIYVDMTLVQQYSKKQSTIDTSVIDAEFVAMKQGIDS